MIEKSLDFVSKDQILLQEQAEQDSVVEIKFLAQTWLDDFEKQLFDGKTLRELLSNNSYE